MMHHIREVVADVAVFLLAFVVSIGACTPKAVTCGGQERAAEARK